MASALLFLDRYEADGKKFWKKVFDRRCKIGAGYSRNSWPGRAFKQKTFRRQTFKQKTVKTFKSMVATFYVEGFRKLATV